MRIKKILARIAVLCLASALLLSVQVHAEDQSQGTTITTTVPDTHTITLDIGEHGSVIVDRTTYTGTQKIEIPRLAEQSYYIKADNGWEIDTVSYGKADSLETVSLDKENRYTASALYEDGLMLKVTWKKAQAQPSDTRQGNTGTGTTTGNNVKTGDMTNPAVWGTLLGLSALLLMYVGTMKQRSIKKNS